MKLVSIVTPVYNIAKFIGDTALAIIGQSYSNWEWIVVDDGSTDDTIAIIKSFNDRRIKIVLHDHVANLSILRNTGIKASSGDYIAFIDGDDLPHEQKLATQVAFFENNKQLQWTHTNVVCLIDETREIKERLMANPPISALNNANDALRKLLVTNFIYISTVMIRKGIVCRGFYFDESYAFCEDINLWLRLTAAGYYPFYIKEPLLTYRISSMNLSTTRRLDYLKTNIRVLNEFRDVNPDAGRSFMSEIRKGYGLKYYRLAHHCLTMKNRAKTIKYLWLSFKQRPFNPPVFKLLVKAILPLP